MTKKTSSERMASPYDFNAPTFNDFTADVDDEGILDDDDWGDLDGEFSSSRQSDVGLEQIPEEWMKQVSRVMLLGKVVNNVCANRRVYLF